MSHDLFGDALVQRRRSPLRRLLTVLSVVFHTVLVAAIVVIQVFAVGPLPTPQQPLIFEQIHTVHLVEIPVPPAPRGASNPSVTETPDRNFAPIEEPHGVIAETGLEGSAPSSAGVVRGVEGGLEGIASFGTPEKAAPPPPPPAPTAPVRLHSGIAAPRKIGDVTPVYPSLAQQAHVKGVVILEAVIDARGNVTDVHVLRSVPLLDQAAIDAVRQWRYTAALLNGRPVPVVITVTINFSM
jgi:protein TonB